jgi:hypothetical protein
MLSLRKFMLLPPLLAGIEGSAAPAAAQVPEVLWRFDLSHVSGSFVSVGPEGRIYTVDQDRLYALDSAGAVQWTFDQAGGLGGLSGAGGGQPMDFLPDGRLVVAGGHTVWALNPDGTVSWSFGWTGGYNNQIDNGPSVGPDGNVYATTAVNNGEGMGVFSLAPEGQLRWQDDASPPLLIINASHGQRLRFTDDRVVFGFIATSGAPSIYAFDFDGDQTNLVNYTCTSSPKTNGVDRLLLAGVCGVQSIDLDTNSIEWSVGLGAVNMLPIAGGDGVVYSASWHGPASAIDPNGQVLWTSPMSVRLQRTLAVSDQHGLFLYAGEIFGQPNWFGAIDTATGASLWQVPFETVGSHNELSWSNEAAFSPDGSVAYFTTRFTSNGAPGRLWAVRIADAPGATTYCTAGSSASGCQAAIDASGLASATSSAGFQLHATGIEGNKDGLFYFGSSGRQASPWGNGTSFQCVAPPLTRGGLLTGVGTNGACDGAFTQDLNALWCPFCPKSAKNPGAGASVQAQLWYRDPQNISNQTTSLSDAIEFSVLP